ncbi:MAG TPA: DUF1223 domain-containing protein [Polyangiaceae bacterium]|nr:DUF1223 domain-containing protein [Polyangiaceae bacterium]
MPHAPRGALCALALLASACSSGAPAAPAPMAPDPTAPAPAAATDAPASADASLPARAPFALVELFTSEGCSSCPPADQTLDELADDAERRGLHVYALSFHVDYWNSLGWVDPFSRSDHTRRQEAYASLAGARGLYTPQMIVNGGEGFIGSDRDRARRDIERALKAAPASAVPLALRVDAARPSVRVELEAPGLPPGARLNVALAERARVQHVARGENAGRTLRHRNVVRAFETLTPRDPGPLRVDLPAAGLDPASLLVVAYAQDPATLAVLGAQAAPVPAPR